MLTFEDLLLQGYDARTTPDYGFAFYSLLSVKAQSYVTKMAAKLNSARETRFGEAGNMVTVCRIL